MMQNGGTAPNMGVPHSPTTSASPGPPQWYEQQKSNGGEIRSVTPAMNNTRGVVRNPPASHPSRIPSPALNTSNTGNPGVTNTIAPPRATTPNRYYGAYNVHDKAPGQLSSTGLIRLTLRKPMGIVFEPMYDPNQASVQRGVRICDLPRTGAAALSRKLEVGDELLSINDKTMSRLTFDEIMDFIIEADPEQVNLLFRRPRKETFAPRVKPPVPSSTPTAGVKWVDDDQRKKGKDDKVSKRDIKNRPKRGSKRDDETIDSEADPGGTAPTKVRGKYENESFLDLLIDTICANPDSVCKSKRGDDDYYSDEDDDRTLNSQDDSTYVTYESEKTDDQKINGKKRDDEYSEAGTEDDTFTSEDERKKKKLAKKSTRSSPLKESKPKQEKKVEKVLSPKKYYEEDATLETIETKDRSMPIPAPPAPPPLGLAPKVPEPREESEPQVSYIDDQGRPAPISTLEYDDFDHGADVSVMESLGGPSLLIEKQRQAAMNKVSEHVVPADIVNTFAQDYPSDFGLSREQTIQKNPLRFYTYVVKLLLQAHEPEKVRLLDKLLAKYKGREDHLVQKLSVRYNRTEEGNDIAQSIPEEEEENGFTTFAGAVNTNKESAATAAAVALAKQRAEDFGAWEDDGVKAGTQEVDDSASGSGSEFSGDSIDGTSPAVIAQVSELLNYVYGKTTVPLQIERVSTIMRAYEGREAVLLELLETKALIKANCEKENNVNLPSFLRNSPSLQHDLDNEENPADEEAIEQSVSPLSSPHMQSQQQAVGGNIINDDISSMSGVSSPAPENKSTAKSQEEVPLPPEKPMMSENTAVNFKVESKSVLEKPRSSKQVATATNESAHRSSAPDLKSKKKGIFGGLFGKKNKRGRRGGKEEISADGSI